MIMEYMVRWKNPCQVETRKLVLIVGIMATAILLFQSFTLPYGNVLLSLVPVLKVTANLNLEGSSQGEDSSLKPMRVSKLHLLSTLAHSRDPLVGLGVVKKREDFKVKGGIDHETETKEKDRDPETDFSSQKDGEPDQESSLQKAVDLNNDAVLKRIRDPYDDFRLERARDIENVFSPGRFRTPGNKIVKMPDVDLVIQKIRIPVDFLSPPLTLSSAISSVNGSVLNKFDMNSSNPVKAIALDISSVGKQTTDTLYKGESPGLLQSSLGTLNSISTVPGNTIIIKKKKKTLPPKPISELNRILLWSHRVSSRAVIPRWSSKHDQQLLSVNAQIKNAPIVEIDRDYSLVFRNFSRFKRSYEIMESIFKVYIYREGQKPIFHQPLLKGIYSSEGWFMKQMEGNKHFVVDDPQKAHMFYLPFSSRFLQNVLYVPGSHNRTNLAKYLKNYVDIIAAKYPFWNRTDGSDHFLVACHDWAQYETRHNMERSIRALCNTDLALGFKIGRDVSLPTTYVRFPQNPLKDVGGKPASQRPNLAFFAGNMHGNLRTILLKHWGHNDPVMKIFGPMTKMKPSYVEFMKTSKYCICPKGYEVNSPRVVEAIFYECVPVIISDNYVPPFFEVLDWEAFSVIVAEKDVPLLKDILLSIPEEKYFAMQLRVKKVQQHFLWHNKPVKYDLFHMILHSIWFNRVHQIKIR